MTSEISDSGVTCAAFVGASAWKMRVCLSPEVSGREIWPVFSENTTASMSADAWPLTIVRRPPFALVPASFEYFRTSSAKFAPEWSCTARRFASCFELTTISRTRRRAGVEYFDSFFR